MVTVSNCPYVFHDSQELSDFLLNCGKYVWYFDGQDVFVNGRYVLTIRVYWSQHCFCEFISYQIFGHPKSSRRRQI
jgi:hypothetical protein